MLLIEFEQTPAGTAVRIYEAERDGMPARLLADRFYHGSAPGLTVDGTTTLRLESIHANEPKPLPAEMERV